jgi:hypothetical protein
MIIHFIYLSFQSNYIIHTNICCDISWADFFSLALNWSFWLSSICFNLLTSFWKKKISIYFTFKCSILLYTFNLLTIVHWQVKSISTLGYFFIYFSIKPLIFKTFSWSHSLSNFNKISSIKCKINVVPSSYNLHIILFLLFLRTWNKHKLWFFSPLNLTI